MSEYERYTAARIEELAGELHEARAALDRAQAQIAGALEAMGGDYDIGALTTTRVREILSGSRPVPVSGPAGTPEHSVGCRMLDNESDECRCLRVEDFREPAGSVQPEPAPGCCAVSSITARRGGPIHHSMLCERFDTAAAAQPEPEGNEA